MGLKDLLKSDEKIEWKGPRVEYNDKEYHVYVTNERLILHAERGFFSKSDDIASWKFEKIDQVNYEKKGAFGHINAELEDKEIKISCGFNEASNLLAKIRARIT